MFLFCLVFAMSLCASVYMCFVVTCWERADLLALVCGVFCEFVTFPLVSWVRCGTWLYRFLIFATLLTLTFYIFVFKLLLTWSNKFCCHFLDWASILNNLEKWIVQKQREPTILENSRLYALFYRLSKNSMEVCSFFMLWKFSRGFFFWETSLCKVSLK